MGETVPTILAVLVDRHAPGVTVGPPMGNKAGLRGLDVCEVRFEDVKIPKVNFLGTDDSCPEILTDLVLGTRLYQAGQMAASMRWVIVDEKMLQHVVGRMFVFFVNAISFAGFLSSFFLFAGNCYP